MLDFLLIHSYNTFDIGDQDNPNLISLKNFKITFSPLGFATFTL